MKPIDNSVFVPMLESSNFIGLPFSWGSDGAFQFDQRMTSEQIDAVNKLYEDYCKL